MAFAAGFALVFARVWLGRGGALYALAFYLVSRTVIALIVAGILGQSTPYFPIYIAEAVCIELAALFLGRERPLRLAVVCGLLVGTVGLAAEWGWSHVWMPVPWTDNILPAAAIVAPIAGVAGALGGALLACALRGQLPEPRLTRRLFGGAIVAMVALCIFGLHTTQPSNLSATITLDRTKSDPGQAIATVRFHPETAADDAAWVRETAWQGGGLVQAPLDRVSEGVYRTPEALPLTGDWKSVIRLQTGTAIQDVPVYMPADPAIPVGAVPARHQVTRPLEPSHQVLQREVKQGIPSWLWTLAASLVMAFWLVMIVLIGIGAGRAGRYLAIASGDERSSDSQPTSSRRASSSAAVPPRRPNSRFA